MLITEPRFSNSNIAAAAEGDSWYAGKGATENSYFTYRIGHTYSEGALVDSPFNMTLYFESYDNASDRWLSKIIIDKIDSPATRFYANFTAYLRGEDMFMLGNSAFQSNGSKFRDIYLHTLDSLAAFATRSHPKMLNTSNSGDKAWQMPNGPDQFYLVRDGNQTISTAAGTFDTTVVQWRWGNSMKGQIWLVPDLPFPIKGTMLDSPYNQTIYSFELLNMGKSTDGANIPEFEPAVLFGAVGLAFAILVGIGAWKAHFTRN